MPRLSDSERERIIGEIGVGTNVREIANGHNVHVSTVYRLMNTFLQNGDVIDRQRSGRPPVTTPRQDRALQRQFRQDPFRTAASVARTNVGTHGRVISDRTVRRRLQSVGLFCRRPLKKPFLMAYHRRARMAWAQQHRAWRLRDFRRVLYTDEVRVCSQPDSGRIKIWRRVGTRSAEQNIMETDRWGGVNVMVLGGIGLNLVLGPVFFLISMMEIPEKV